MPFHATCLIYLVQLIAVENVYRQWQVFVAHYWQECGGVAGRPGRNNTLALGAGVRRGHLWTWNKLTLWRTSSGKFWLWLYTISIAELRGWVEMGRRTHQDAHSSGAGHWTSHQLGFLPKDQPQLFRNPGTKDIPAYIWEWDLTLWSSAVPSYQLVYIFILFCIY